MRLHPIVSCVYDLGGIREPYPIPSIPSGEGENLDTI